MNAKRRCRIPVAFQAVRRWSANCVYPTRRDSGSSPVSWERTDAMRYISSSSLLSSLVLLALAAPAAQAVTVNDLGTLGGTRSSGFKINNHGGVIGYSTLAGDFADSAFYFDGTMHTVGLGGSTSTASDLNEAGQVAGGGFTAGDADFQAFFYQNGQAKIPSP